MNLTQEEIKAILLLFRFTPIESFGDKLDKHIGREAADETLRTLISLNSKLKGARA